MDDWFTAAGVSNGRLFRRVNRAGRIWELALMADLVPLLNKRAHGRDISGLNAYEQGGAR